MKISFQANPKNAHSLILLSKDRKATNRFLKTENIDANSYDLAFKLGSTSTSNKKEVLHLLTLSSNPKDISLRIAKWVQSNANILPTKLTVVVQKELIGLLDAILLGVLQGTYQLGLYKSQKNSNFFSLSKGQLSIKGNVNKQTKDLVRQAQAIYAAQQLAMDMVNAPGNKLKPSDMAAKVKAAGRKTKYSVKVFGKKQIQQKGLDALLAVNRGSEWDPAFIIAEYKGKAPKGKKLPRIGLIGKGVTFDTGGISMKGPNNMQYMKSDMGGAAAALGTLDAAARLKLPVHLIAIVPSTDNCVDAKAIKPGDVIGSYSKKSIEVTDTDAEGRLILADGLWFMQKHYKPDVMIDLATLTGSSVRTFGYEAAALFSTNNKLSKALQYAGESSGEKCWPLPMWKSYEKYLHSDIADVKNYSGKPFAGAITAAKFLEVFTNEHPSWAHLDIAGVAFGEGPSGKDKSGTGFGIRLLIRYLQENFA